MFAELGHDPLECVIRDAVARGYTITIGPHTDAPCGVFAEKDGQKWGRGCDVDARQIDKVLQNLPSLWNYEVTPIG